MELTVSEQIIEVLNVLCDKFGLAIDWTGQNVLPYAQELAEKMVNYELWTSVMWMFLFVTGTFLCLFIGWKITKSKDFEWDPDELASYAAITLVFAGIILGILSAIVIVAQTMDVVTCLTFPEKIIFEIVQSIV